MQFDLRQVPFRRNGAYMAISVLEPAGAFPGGLYLRGLHGGAGEARPDGRVALLEPVVDGQPIPYDALAFPDGLDLQTDWGMLSLTLADAWVLRVRGEGVGLRLSFFPVADVEDAGDFAVSAGDARWRITSPALGMQWMLTPLAGRWRAEPLGDSGRLIVELLSDGEACEGAMEEFIGSWRPRMYEESFEECRAGVMGEFDHWCEQLPTLPDEYQDAAPLAAYLHWSSVVEAVGHFLRPSMLTQKGRSANVWSSDHCLQAMPLAYRKGYSAWDQFMTLFDMQDEFGALPDWANDRSMQWSFCKPPLHGLALDWMMSRTSFIRGDQVRQIYGPLARWTEWWFSYRDDDRDGLPQYQHVLDSGWGRATPFSVGLPLESPDLCALLALQMETLARLAAALKDGEEAESWQRRSEDLLQKMLAHFWQGDHFVAMRSGDHLVSDTESLFLYLPLMLGKRLPLGVRSELIAGLSRPGRFLTRYGLATESPSGLAYQPDVPGRGPIAPQPTLALVEGLAACGELTLARDVARKFCDLCAERGFYEYFDALTGDGLGEPANTTTASVFLVLGREYLIEE